MFGTTASKLVTSAFLVAVSAGGMASADKSASASAPNNPEVPIALSDNSLLVATLANGEIQSQWMSTEACERVSAAVGARTGVAGVRSDGVRITIARANCSTPRVEVHPNTVAANSLPVGN